MHQPQRDDEVAAWLKRWRDYHEGGVAYETIDRLLDDYRTRADYGMNLQEEVEGHL